LTTFLSDSLEKYRCCLGYHAEREIYTVPVTVVLSILIVYFIFKNSNKFYRFSLSMILGGALGNLIDRVFRTDGVVDFLDFQFGNYHFPVFNVADTFVVVELCF